MSTAAGSITIKKGRRVTPKPLAKVRFSKDSASNKAEVYGRTVWVRDERGGGLCWPNQRLSSLWEEFRNDARHLNVVLRSGTLVWRGEPRVNLLCSRAI